MHSICSNLCIILFYVRHYFKKSLIYEKSGKITTLIKLFQLRGLQIDYFQKEAPKNFGKEIFCIFHTKLNFEFIDLTITNIYLLFFHVLIDNFLYILPKTNHGSFSIMKANDQQMKLRSEKHHSDSLEKNKRPGSVRFFDMIEKIIKNADGSSNVRGFPVCGGRFSPFPDLQHRESILK